MSASPESNVAGAINKTSFEGHTSRTISEKSLENTEKSQPHPTALLGLP
jgi:hypothetical protein